MFLFVFCSMKRLRTSRRHRLNRMNMKTNENVGTNHMHVNKIDWNQQRFLSVWLSRCVYFIQCTANIHSPWKTSGIWQMSLITCTFFTSSKNKNGIQVISEQMRPLFMHQIRCMHRQYGRELAVYQWVISIGFQHVSSLQLVLIASCIYYQYITNILPIYSPKNSDEKRKTIEKANKQRQIAAIHQINCDLLEVAKKQTSQMTATSHPIESQSSCWRYGWLERWFGCVIHCTVSPITLITISNRVIKCHQKEEKQKQINVCLLDRAVRRKAIGKMETHHEPNIVSARLPNVNWYTRASINHRALIDHRIELHHRQIYIA